MREGDRRHQRDRFGLILAAGLFVAAVIQQLRQPKDERQWVGKVAKIVPYDLRRPTAQRLLASVWSPDDPRLFMPYGFGVGWTLNLGRVVRLLKQRAR
jgi:hypothetical protein